jgi:hypothetical protein
MAIPVIEVLVSVMREGLRHPINRNPRRSSHLTGPEAARKPTSHQNHFAEVLYALPMISSGPGAFAGRSGSSVQLFGRYNLRARCRATHVPASAAKDRLSSPQSRITGHLDAHPPGLAALLAEEAPRKFSAEGLRAPSRKAAAYPTHFTSPTAPELFQSKLPTSPTP